LKIIDFQVPKNAMHFLGFISNQEESEPFVIYWRGGV